MARLEIPSIVVHNGPPSVPGASGMERTAHHHHPLHKQKSDAEDNDGASGCVHHSHSHDPGPNNTAKTNNRPIDTEPTNNSKNNVLANNNNNNSSNANNNNGSRSSDSSKPSSGSLSRSRSNGKMKMLTRSHAMREATSPPPDPSAQHNLGSATSSATSVSSSTSTTATSAAETSTAVSSNSAVQTAASSSSTAVTASTASTVPTATSQPVTVTVSSTSTQNNSHSNNSHSQSNNGNHLSVSRSNSRPKLRRQSSSQSSIDSWSPYLSRDNSTEYYTDATGTDLELFLTETVNQSPKTRDLMFKVEQELYKLATNREMVYYRFPSMSSFHRMLIHRAAAWFGMEHNLDLSGNCVIVNRSKNTRIPDKCFSDFVQDDFLYPEEPRKVILKRDSASFEDSQYKSSDEKQLGMERRSKSFEEREEEYEKVRRRIFNRDDDGQRRSNDSTRDCADEIRWQDVQVWSSYDSELTGRHLRPKDRHRMLKAESFEARDSFKGNSNRSAVSKSNSFGEYSGSLQRGDSNGSFHGSGCRVLSKQDSGSSVSSRLSPSSSSGYKSLSQRNSDATLSATPSPTATPNSLNHMMSSQDTLSPEPQPVMWPMTMMASIPPGSVLINPATGQPICNADGSVYRYDPDNPLKPQAPPSDNSDPALPSNDNDQLQHGMQSGQSRNSQARSSHSRQTKPVVIKPVTCQALETQAQSDSQKLNRDQMEQNHVSPSRIPSQKQAVTTQQTSSQSQHQTVTKPQPNNYRGSFKPNQTQAQSGQSKANLVQSSQSTQHNVTQGQHSAFQPKYQGQSFQSKSYQSYSGYSKATLPQIVNAQQPQCKTNQAQSKPDNLKPDFPRVEQTSEEALSCNQSKPDRSVPDQITKALPKSEPFKPEVSKPDQLKPEIQIPEQCKADESKFVTPKLDQPEPEQVPTNQSEGKKDEEYSQPSKQQRDSSASNLAVPLTESITPVRHLTNTATSPLTLPSPQRQPPLVPAQAGQPLVMPSQNIPISQQPMLPLMGQGPTNSTMYPSSSPYPNCMNNIYATTPDGSAYMNGSYPVPYMATQPMTHMNGYPVNVDPTTGAYLTHTPSTPTMTCCQPGYACPYSTQVMAPSAGTHPCYDRRTAETNGMCMSDVSSYMMAMNIDGGPNSVVDQRAGGDGGQTQSQSQPSSGPQTPQTPQTPQIMSVPGQHPGTTYYWGPQISSQTQGYPQMIPMYYIPQNVGTPPQTSTPVSATVCSAVNSNSTQNTTPNSSKDNVQRETINRDVKDYHNRENSYSKGNSSNRSSTGGRNVAASFAKGAALYQPPTYSIAMSSPNMQPVPAPQDRNLVNGFSGECMAVPGPQQGVHMIYSASPVHSNTIPTQAYQPNPAMTPTGSAPGGGPLSYYQTAPGGPGSCDASGQPQPLIAMSPYGPQQGYNPAVPTPPLTPTPMLGAQGTFGMSHPYLYGNGLGGAFGVYPQGGGQGGPNSPPSYPNIASNQSPLIRGVPRPNMAMVGGVQPSHSPRHSISKGLPRGYPSPAGRKDHGMQGDHGSMDKVPHMRYPQAIPVSMLNLSPRYMSGDVRLMSAPRFPFTIPTNYSHRGMRPLQHSYFPRPHSQPSSEVARPPRVRKTT